MVGDGVRRDLGPSSPPGGGGGRGGGGAELWLTGLGPRAALRSAWDLGARDSGPAASCLFR